MHKANIARFIVTVAQAGRYSSVGSDVALESRSTRSILVSGTSFREDLVISTAILPLIQEEQLSVNGKRMCAKCPGTVWIG